MRSRFSATGRGFTLLELIVVLAIAGLVLGITAAALYRSSASSARKRAMEEMVIALGATRVEAMRRASAIEIEVSTSDNEVTLVAGDRTRTWEAPGLVAQSAMKSTFEPSGLIRARAWRFADTTHSQATLFTVVFDPISGAPALRRGAGSRNTEAELP